MFAAEIVFLLLILGLLVWGVLVIFGKILGFVFKRVDDYLSILASLVNSRVGKGSFGFARSIEGHYQDRKIKAYVDLSNQVWDLDVSILVQTASHKAQSFLPFSKKPTQHTSFSGKKVHYAISRQSIITLTDSNAREAAIKKILDELIEAVRIVEQGEKFYKE